MSTKQELRKQLEDAYKEMDEHRRAFSELEDDHARLVQLTQQVLPNDPPLHGRPELLYSTGLQRAWALRHQHPDVFLRILRAAMARTRSISSWTDAGLEPPQRPPKPKEAVRIGFDSHLPVHGDCVINGSYEPREKINSNFFATIPDSLPDVQEQFGKNFLVSTMVSLHVFYPHDSEPPPSWMSVSHLCHFPYCVYWKHIPPESTLWNTIDRYACQMVGECSCGHFPPCFPWTHPSYDDDHSELQARYEQLFVGEEPIGEKPAVVENSSEPQKKRGTRPTKAAAAAMDRRFKCLVSGCGRNYPTLKGLKEHAKTKHDETNEEVIETLRQGELTNTERKTFHCGECGKGFTMRNNLLAHLRKFHPED